jgi:sec-independent protein translocase protein TatA
MDLGIGFMEILAILLIALLVFGPGKLPEIARTIGRFSRSLKRMSSEFTTAMTKELELEEKARQTHLRPQEARKDVSPIPGAGTQVPKSPPPNSTPATGAGQPPASANPDSLGKT